MDQCGGLLLNDVQVPIMCCSATADAEMVGFCQEALQLKECRFFRGDMSRFNIKIYVEVSIVPSVCLAFEIDVLFRCCIKQSKLKERTEPILFGHDESVRTFQGL